MSVVQQVKNDLVGWKLGRVITVLDRGFSSEDNLKYLQRAGGHYIAGEKLRSGKVKTEKALSHPGRFKQVRDNLEIKEIIVGDGEARIRYILVRNPKEALKDKAKREEMINKIKQELAAIGELNGAPHTKAVCNFIAHPTYGRYLKTDKKGQPKLNQAKIKAEEKLDGKYLMRTSDDTISPEDVALGYKQLLEVEDAFRTLKTTLLWSSGRCTTGWRIGSGPMCCSAGWRCYLFVALKPEQVIPGARCGSSCRECTWASSIPATESF